MADEDQVVIPDEDDINGVRNNRSRAIESDTDTDSDKSILSEQEEKSEEAGRSNQDESGSDSGVAGPSQVRNPARKSKRLSEKTSKRISRINKMNSKVFSDSDSASSSSSSDDDDFIPVEPSKPPKPIAKKRPSYGVQDFFADRRTKKECVLQGEQYSSDDGFVVDSGEEDKSDSSSSASLSTTENRLAMTKKRMQKRKHQLSESEAETESQDSHCKAYASDDSVSEGEVDDLKQIQNIPSSSKKKKIESSEDEDGSFQFRSPSSRQARMKSTKKAEISAKLDALKNRKRRRVNRVVCEDENENNEASEDQESSDEDKNSDNSKEDDNESDFINDEEEIEDAELGGSQSTCIIESDDEANTLEFKPFKLDIVRDLSLRKDAKSLFIDFAKMHLKCVAYNQTSAVPRCLDDQVALYWFERQMTNSINLATSQMQKGVFKKQLENLPSVDAVEVGFEGDMCDICNRKDRFATWKITFNGLPYNKKTLEPTSGTLEDNLISSEPYAAGRLCALRAILCHKLHHYRYNFFNEACADRWYRAFSKSSSPRPWRRFSCDGPKTQLTQQEESALENCLRDDTWLSQEYSNFNFYMDKIENYSKDFKEGDIGNLIGILLLREQGAVVMSPVARGRRRAQRGRQHIRRRLNY